MNSCIFCTIVKGGKSYTIYEDNVIKAFLDIFPASEGHVLIIPIKHRKDITEVTSYELNAMNKLAKRLAKAIMKSSKTTGVNVMSSNGKSAQQEILHFHMHVIPRTRNGPLRVKYNPQKLRPADFERIARAIKSEMRVTGTKK